MKPTSLAATASAATALVAAAFLTACASGGNMASTPTVPANLAPPAGEKQAFVHFARGVQIYRCAAAPTQAAAITYGWAFVAPQAELYATAAQAAVLGTHGAGPHWLAADGSRVTGVVKARADAPVAGAIPWLLLATTPNDKPGLMAPVTHIQRINTAAGVAPASGCAAAADVGKEARVPYTTQYVYFVRG